MKRMICSTALLFLALSALAQTAPAPAAKPAPAQAAKPAPSIAAAVDRQVTILEREFVSAAEAMPEDKFGFTPSSLSIPGAEFKGVRTFAEQVKHVATANFVLWAPITGEKPAYDLSKDNGPDSIKTKAEIIKFLKESFELGHRAAKSLTPESSTETVTTFFGPATPKILAATYGVAHGFDHYGQMVEYLRMNGIIPPASRPQPK